MLDWARTRVPSWAKPAGRLLRRCAIRVHHYVVPVQWPRSADGKIRINLGCGWVSHPAFINVDLLCAWHIHYIRRIDDLNPFPDDVADLVYASHCLEHFSYTEVNRVLREWWRVLKPGGVLRVSVPDFESLLAIYEQSGRDIEVVQHFLMGGQTDALNSHLTMFTAESLTRRLESAGFRTVHPWTPGTDELSSLGDASGFLADVNGIAHPISLNLAAVK